MAKAKRKPAAKKPVKRTAKPERVTKPKRAKPAAKPTRAAHAKPATKPKRGPPPPPQPSTARASKPSLVAELAAARPTLRVDRTQEVAAVDVLEASEVDLAWDDPD